MKITQLEYLWALYKYRSFSRASQELFVSQPSISVGIKELEAELGYLLIIRNNRGITFTEEGEAVVEMAKQILADVKAIQQIEPHDNKTLSGQVCIGCTAPYCKSIALDVMLTLRIQAPCIKVSVNAWDSKEIIQKVMERECQLGIIHLNDIDETTFTKRIERGQLNYGELFKDELCIAVRNDHPLTMKQNLALEDLLAYPFVTPNKGVNPALVEYYRRAGKEGSVICVGDVSALRRYLFHAYPIAVIPKQSLLYGNTLFQDQLTSLNIPEWNWSCDVVWIHGNQISEAVQKTLDLIINRCKPGTDMCCT